MGKRGQELPLSSLATHRVVAAATRTRPHGGRRVLYVDVLGVKLAWPDDIARGKKPKRLPV